MEEVFTPLGQHAHVLHMYQSLTACIHLKFPFHNEENILNYNLSTSQNDDPKYSTFQENTVMLISNALFTDHLHIFVYTKSKAVFTR